MVRRSVVTRCTVGSNPTFSVFYLNRLIGKSHGVVMIKDMGSIPIRGYHYLARSSVAERQSVKLVVAVSITVE